MVATSAGKRSISMRHSMVLPLPTSPDTLTMPSSCSTAYASASSVGPRSAPSKKKSVCGVMRNGGSFSPKCSRYRAKLLLLAAAGVHPAVERRAIDAKELGGLADAAAREAQRRFDVTALPGLERVVQVEGDAALELALGLLDGRAALGAGRQRSRLEVELRLELGHREALPRILGRQANRDIAQLAHVARKIVALPACGRARVELEGLRERLRRGEAAEMLEQHELVALHLAQRRHAQRKDRQAVVEIGAEATAAHFASQVAVGRRDQAGACPAPLRP